MTAKTEQHFDIHRDQALFKEALSYTTTSTGFRSDLIEKDYYCSLLLASIYAEIDHAMIFKGSTCLSKVYAGFYRLSEDLDFSIALETEAPTRAEKRQKMKPIKELISTLPDKLSGLSLSGELKGFNNSTQYTVNVVYQSISLGQPSNIKLEIGIREKLLDPPSTEEAGTILLNPLKRSPVVPGFRVSCLSLSEAMSEKIRAALTRRDPAIRDFYDVDFVANKLDVDLMSNDMLKRVLKKLEIPGNEPPDASSAKKDALKLQLEPQLKPVLRQEDYERFDLDRAFATVESIYNKIQTIKSS